MARIKRSQGWTLVQRKKILAVVVASTTMVTVLVIG